MIPVSSITLTVILVLSMLLFALLITMSCEIASSGRATFAEQPARGHLASELDRPTRYTLGARWPFFSPTSKTRSSASRTRNSIPSKSAMTC